MRNLTSLFLGYLIGALAVVIFDRFYEGGWRGGFDILRLSIPTTAVYFVVVLAIAVWRSLSPGPVAVITCGILIAVYPFFFGFFPVYYLRWEFAIPVVAIQLGLMLAILAMSSRLRSKRARAL